MYFYFISYILNCNYIYKNLAYIYIYYFKKIFIYIFILFYLFVFHIFNSTLSIYEIYLFIYFFQYLYKIYIKLIILISSNNIRIIDDI